MKIQIKAQLAVHLLKRIIDGDKNAIYLTVCICLAIHLEHLSKCRVGVCTGAMPEFVSVRGDVVVESYMQPRTADKPRLFKALPLL